jgi:predicted membrane channel-forming protein YqfA (hemolysin III family)
MISSPRLRGGIVIFINAKNRRIRATLFVAMGLSAIFPIGHLLTLLPVCTLQTNLTAGKTVT